METDAKRIEIMLELVRRAGAEDQGTEGDYYRRLEASLAPLIIEASGDAVKIMGLVRALLATACAVSHGSVGTTVDIQVREADDMGRLVGGLWDETCRVGEGMVAHMKQQGIDVPEEIKRKVELAPSDPTMRPDIIHHDPTTQPSQPESVEDILGMINSAGTAGEN